jgi:hypothetical protein
MSETPSRKAGKSSGGDSGKLAWRTAEASSGGSCVEVAWHNAEASNSASCVEAGWGACGMVHVRDSKDRDGPVLNFTRGEWAAFLDGARRGEFDQA